MSDNYFDHLNRPVRLGETLGSGGEGVVRAVATAPNLAAKVYSKPLSFFRIAENR